MWFKNAIFYQIYPLGFCNVPKQNSWDYSNSWNNACAPLDSNNSENIRKVCNWIPHLQKLQINAVYFSPLFQSDSHGYDTRDYYTIDSRLGSNDDFAFVCNELHSHGIRVVVDGVFNHVGRGFWAFRDVLKNRENSLYKDWFFIDWNRDSVWKDSQGRGDGFFTEGWEGHYDLVKLNLRNPAVVDHLFGAIKKWIELFHIDGIRLDVAYCLDDNFLQQLRSFTESLPGEKLVLIGEILFGDYNTKVNDKMLHSCTNYECYKGLWSSCNDNNLFEIAYAFNRQQGVAENHNNQIGIYAGKSLFSFVDNHDVSRLASTVTKKEYLAIIYGMLFSMHGTPCLYYGSEWGILGDKKGGDHGLRPCLSHPEWNELTDFIAKLSYLHSVKKALYEGTYTQLMITNSQLIFMRKIGNEKPIVVAINISDSEYWAVPNNSAYGAFSGLSGNWKNLITGEIESLSGSLCLASKSILFIEEQ